VAAVIGLIVAFDPRMNSGYRQERLIAYSGLLKIPTLCAIVIHMTNPSTTTSVLSVRVSPDERAILESAAEQTRTSLSDFMRRKSLEAAEVEMLNRNIVTIPAKDWEAFEAWIARPAEAVQALSELARRTSSWR
jgi:uncharacterized protein (DUF1778 family)